MLLQRRLLVPIAAIVSIALADGANACALSSSPVTLTSGVTLRQAVDETARTVTIEMTYIGTAWLSFGTSPTGNMEGSNVVIGKPTQGKSQSNPEKYSISSYHASGINLMPHQTLTNATLTQRGGKTALRYTKLLVEPGEQTIYANKPNTFIFAVGDSNVFGMHRTQGSFQLSLTKCSNLSHAVASAAPQAPAAPIVDPSPNKKLWMAHGWLMAISWVFLVPIGIANSLFRRVVNRLTPGLWFRIHMSGNGASFILMTAAFAIAIHLIRKEEGAANFNDNSHRYLGLTVYLLTFVQILIGIFRPSMTTKKSDTPCSHQLDVESDLAVEDSNDGREMGVGDVEGQPSGTPKETAPCSPTAEDDGAMDRKTWSRVAFELGHRLLGFGLIGLAWYNCFTGIDIMMDD